MKKKGFTVELMTEIAVFSALGFVLDLLQGAICNFLPFWPNGGSVGIAMCAVFILSFRHGLWGLLSGFIVGVLSMMTGVWISPLADSWYKVFFQLFLDYFGAWTVVGLAGLFSKLILNEENVKKRVLWISLACISGGMGKYLMHFLAGMLFWPTSDDVAQSIYSLTYNGSYMIPSIILCAVLMSIIILTHPEFLTYGFKEESFDEEK